MSTRIRSQRCPLSFTPKGFPPNFITSNRHDGMGSRAWAAPRRNHSRGAAFDNVEGELAMMSCPFEYYISRT